MQGNYWDDRPTRFVPHKVTLSGTQVTVMDDNPRRKAIILPADSSNTYFLFIDPNDTAAKVVTVPNATQTLILTYHNIGDLIHYRFFAIATANTTLVIGEVEYLPEGGEP